MEDKKLGISRFFEGYFKNFPKLLLVNILFGIPFVIFSGVFYYLNILTKLNSSAILFLPIIFLYPVFAGVTLTTRNMIKSEESFPVVKTFLKGIKDNFLYFIVHGLVLYVVSILCYSSLLLYWNLAKTMGIFYLFFGVALIITFLILFIFYNIPVMTVTFDLSLKDIYKNCFLMSFGEIKNNFFATVGLSLLALVCFTILLFSTNPIILVVLLVIVGILIIPATASYVINFYVYKDMENIMLVKSGVKIETDKEIEEKRIKENNEKTAKEILDFSDVDLDENKDGNEYLYFNGKMIKRSVLIDMKNKQESEDE